MLQVSIYGSPDRSSGAAMIETIHAVLLTSSHGLHLLFIPVLLRLSQWKQLLGWILPQSLHSFSAVAALFLRAARLVALLA